MTNRERRQQNDRRRGKAVQGGGVKRLHLLATIEAKRYAEMEAAARKGR